MSFHHVMLAVSSFKEARAFYLAALAPVGYEEVTGTEGIVSGLGVNGQPSFWLRPVKAENDAISKGVHIAFAAQSRDAVNQFYEAALKAGGRDNGAPGERKFMPGYYAAFVFDSDGNNVEVMHI